MNMLAGIYFPDEGQIFVNGKEVTIRSPKDAYQLGIGMIHQHFKLVDVFTAAENIVLGLKEKGSWIARPLPSRSGRSATATASTSIPTRRSTT
jgi:simple sugar transport system ATP-binding protein